MAIFMEPATKESTQLSPEQRAEIMQWAEASDATIRRCLAMLLHAIGSKIRDHGHRFVASEYLAMSQAMSNIAYCYQVLDSKESIPDPSNQLV